MVDSLLLTVHSCHQAGASLWEHNKSWEVEESSVCQAPRQEQHNWCMPHLLHPLEHQRSKDVTLLAPVFFMEEV